MVSDSNNSRSYRVYNPAASGIKKTVYEGVDFPVSGLLPQFASENAVNVKPYLVYAYNTKMGSTYSQEVFSKQDRVVGV